MDKEILVELVQEADTNVGSIGVHKEKLQAMSVAMGHIQDDISNTDKMDKTASAYRLYEIEHKILMITELLRYTVNELEEDHEKGRIIKESLFDIIIRGESDDE